MEVDAAKYLHLPAVKLPSNWSWKRLDEICNGVFDCPHSTPKLVSAGDYFLVRTQDILTGTFRVEMAGHVSAETYKDRIQRAEPVAGDLLYSREGTYFGIAAEVPKGIKVCLGQRMMLIKPKREIVNGRYLRYWLNSPIMSAHIYGFRDGSVAERLNLPTVRGLPIAIPPLSEQRVIAETLGALDDKVELNRRMNRTLESIARAIFNSLFANEQIPENWSWGILGDLANRVIDKPKNKSEWYSERLIDLSRMPQSSIALENFGFGNELSTSVTRFHKGDILFGAIRPYFHKVGIAPFAGVTNISVLLVRPIQAYDIPFVLLLTSQKTTIDHAVRMSKGTKMPVVSWEDMKTMPCLIPPDDIRNSYFNTAMPLIEKIIQNIHENITLASLRDTLLPKLMRGEVRVKK